MAHGLHGIVEQMQIDPYLLLLLRLNAQCSQILTAIENCRIFGVNYHHDIDTEHLRNEQCFYFRTPFAIHVHLGYVRNQ